MKSALKLRDLRVKALETRVSKPYMQVNLAIPIRTGPVQWKPLLL